ncbi:hypothetical protein VVD49_15205 [Uliginosibacterium sp. H3]|uniref:Pectate lyase domain-containing protein n=1 Tax=Uliginosibacterium silvisoli TaxID=3114758 RepID=A0ABU6K7V9_9RHOO|nr:hypothetical protein [Uliginosibacterium sp. H3]
MKLLHLISSALLATTLSFGAHAANRPGGYVTICTEGKTCSVSSATSVAYGRADKFTFKTLTGSFVCSEATFGAGTKVAGGTNECSVPSGTSSSSSSVTPSSSSSSKSSSSSVTPSSSSSSSSTPPASSSSSKSSASSSVVACTTTGGTPTDGFKVDGFASINALGLGTTTGGVGGCVVKVKTLDELKTYSDSNNKYVILIDGVIDLAGMVPLRSDKTVIGLSGSKLINGGFEIYKRQNIVIRNVFFQGAPDDTLKINQNTHHVWVDHCTFSDGDVYPDGKEHDGLFDITRQTSNITISYSLFKNHSKTMLIGHSDSASDDTGFLKTTIHHNVFATDQRHPRVRFGEVHVYNNYYLANSLYGVASTMNAKVLLEGNYFKNVPYPSYVGYAESGPGELVQRNNILDNSGPFQTAGSAFDPKTYYSYTVDDPSTIPNLTSKVGVGIIDPWKAAGTAPF